METDDSSEYGQFGLENSDGLPYVLRKSSELSVVTTTISVPSSVVVVTRFPVLV